MLQLELFEPRNIVSNNQKVVNVSNVPQRSPFRYAGGKTWLIPKIRQWLHYHGGAGKELIEPFAGGGIVSLTAAYWKELRVAAADHIVKTTEKTIPTISQKHYMDLLNQDDIIPKIIGTQQEYDHFLAVAERLISKKHTRTVEETILFQLLVKLIRDYEEEAYDLQEWSKTPA
jgi:site-specific DNA-adenine methylase